MIRIVLADDEPDVLESTVMVLETYGYEVTGVPRAADIIPTLLKVKPDILMQDVFMPGLELERHIQDIRSKPELRSVRLLIFTASVEGEEIARQVGADGVVRKPFDAGRIQETLERAMHAPAAGR